MSGLGSLRKDPVRKSAVVVVALGLIVYFYQMDSATFLQVLTFWLKITEGR